jgi:hypothetical protein
MARGRLKGRIRSVPPPGLVGIAAAMKRIAGLILTVMLVLALSGAAVASASRVLFAGAVGKAQVRPAQLALSAKERSRSAASGGARGAAPGRRGPAPPSATAAPRAAGQPGFITRPSRSRCRMSAPARAGGTTRTWRCWSIPASCSTPASCASAGTPAARADAAPRRGRAALDRRDPGRGKSYGPPRAITFPAVPAAALWRLNGAKLRPLAAQPRGVRSSASDSNVTPSSGRTTRRGPATTWPATWARIPQASASATTPSPSPAAQ